LLKFEVAGHVCVDEDLGELSRGDDELGDEVDRVVAITSELGGWFFIVEFTVELRTCVSA
jgi:hypothetical protein